LPRILQKGASVEGRAAVRLSNEDFPVKYIVAKLQFSHEQ
jgi:hypothetical protein